MSFDSDLAKLSHGKLSVEEEVSLVKAYKDHGCIDSRNKLVECYIPYALKLIHIFNRSRSPVSDDLKQEVLVCVLKSLKKYDLARGTRFGTYMQYGIRSNIYDFYKSNRSIVKSSKTTDFSLNAFRKNNGDESDTWMDILPDYASTPEENYEDNEWLGFARDAFLDATSELTERQSQILYRRRLKDDPDALEDIAEDFGISKQAVKQNEDRALEKLCRAIEEAHGVAIDAKSLIKHTTKHKRKSGPK